MVVSYAETARCMPSNLAGKMMTSLCCPPCLPRPRPGMTPILPVDYWRNENDFLEFMSARQPYQFLSPMEAHFFPRARISSPGNSTTVQNSMMCCELSVWRPPSIGQPFYVSDESEEKTYVGEVGADGKSQI